MNSVFELAQSMTSHNQANDQLAKSILAELGAESVSKQSFNDDDIYTYNKETLELLPGRGAHYESIQQLKYPLCQVKGMTAKYLGLWQYKEVAV